MEQIPSHDRSKPDEESENLDHMIDTVIDRRDTGGDTDAPTGSITNMESQYGTQGSEPDDSQDAPEVDPFDEVAGGDAPSTRT